MVGSRGVQKNTYKYTAMAAQEAMAAGSRSRCRPCFRRKSRQGRDGCPFRRRRRAPRQQGIDAQCGRQRHRRQQPRERRGPERQKCLFRQPFDRERTDDRDDQDHDAAREAQL